MFDFIKDKVMDFGVDYIKNNPEMINYFCNEILSFCENFELNENENRSVIMIFRNKLNKPQLSIVGVTNKKIDLGNAIVPNYTNLDIITSVKKSFTSENLFELLKKQEK